MKQIINLKRNENPNITKLENAIRDAKQTYDYLQINIPRNNYFIRISFNRDFTYTIGFNIWDLQFFTETNLLYRQYHTAVIAGISKYLDRQIRRLNT